MPVTDDHQPGEPITAADINALAALANTNESALTGKASTASVTAEAATRAAADTVLAVDLAAGDVAAVATAAADATAKAGAAQAAAVQRANHTGTQPSTSISDFTEAVQDAVAALLGAGSNITLNYNDAGNTLTVTGVGDGTGLDAEAVRDAIGVALVGVGNIAVTVNDALDTITISTTATANSTDAQLRDRSTHTGTQAATTITGLAAVATSGAKADVGLGNVDNTADGAKPVSTAQQTALDAKADKLLTENPQTGTAYTLVLGDASKLVEMSNVAANTLTVPPNSSVAFPVGTVINVRQYGAGQTTLTPGSGVTIRSRGGALKLHSQYAEASLVKRGTDEWVATGDLTT